jgi:HAMP domain-containing protein
MTELHSNDAKLSAVARIGSQPILFAAGALIVIVAGICAIFAWRSYTGTSPEQDKIANGRLVQARVAQASEQLVTKTKDLEVTQQQSIDQLQMVQDQLQAIQQMLTAQRIETKRLTEKVGDLSGSLDTMRQSFASAQSSEAAEPQAVRSKPAARPHRVAGKKKARTAATHRRGKSRS